MVVKKYKMLKRMIENNRGWKAEIQHDERVPQE